VGGPTAAPLVDGRLGEPTAAAGFGMADRGLDRYHEGEASAEHLDMGILLPVGHFAGVFQLLGRELRLMGSGRQGHRELR
jgi:hypothetical protein